MDLRDSKKQDQLLTRDFLDFLEFKQRDGVLFHKSLRGEITYANDIFHYAEEGKDIKKLTYVEDITSILFPVSEEERQRKIGR